MSKGAASRLASGESFELYWWIELKNVSSIQDWLKVIEEGSLAGLGILKIFADDPADLATLHGIKNLSNQQIKWTEANLKELLKKRLEGCQWNADPGKWDRHMAANNKLVTKDNLIQRAQGSPRHLIRLGNEILFLLGQE